MYIYTYNIKSLLKLILNVVFLKKKSFEFYYFRVDDLKSLDQVGVKLRTRVWLPRDIFYYYADNIGGLLQKSDKKILYLCECVVGPLCHLSC